LWPSEAPAVFELPAVVRVASRARPAGGESAIIPVAAVVIGKGEGGDANRGGTEQGHSWIYHRLRSSVGIISGGATHTRGGDKSEGNPAKNVFVHARFDEKAGETIQKKTCKSRAIP
jgi:hypothetical protein